MNTSISFHPYILILSLSIDLFRYGFLIDLGVSKSTFYQIYLQESEETRSTFQIHFLQWDLQIL